MGQENTCLELIVDNTKPSKEETEKLKSYKKYIEELFEKYYKKILSFMQDYKKPKKVIRIDEWKRIRNSRELMLLEHLTMAHDERDYHSATITARKIYYLVTKEELKQAAAIYRLSALFLLAYDKLEANDPSLYKISGALESEETTIRVEKMLAKKPYTREMLLLRAALIASSYKALQAYAEHNGGPAEEYYKRMEAAIQEARQLKQELENLLLPL